MTVFLNGDEVIIEEGETLKSLLIKRNILNHKGIAVAVNDMVIPKSNWELSLLSDGDKITLIMATAGG